DVAILETYFSRQSGQQRDQLVLKLLQEGRSGYNYRLSTMVSMYLNDARSNLTKADPATRIRGLTEAIAQTEKAAPAAYNSTISARLWLAEAYDKDGKSNEAETQLKELVGRAKIGLDRYLYVRDQVAIAQAWFYLSKGRAPEALSVLAQPPFDSDARRWN